MGNRFCSSAKKTPAYPLTLRCHVAYKKVTLPMREYRWRLGLAVIH